MSVLNRLARLLGGNAKATAQQDRNLLEPAEIRLIVEGNPEKLATFAASSRLHSVSLSGETPLHLAARNGNLAVCDLFIRSGADPLSLSHDSKTPADLALSKGHHLVSQLLLSLVQTPPKHEKVTTNTNIGQSEIAAEGFGAIAGQCFDVFIEVKPDDTIDELDDLLNFEAEAEPEEFFGHSKVEKASGTFAVHISPAPLVSDNEDVNWDLDISPVHIYGEGIGSSVAGAPEQVTNHEFLEVRNRGRKSIKKAVVLTGTRLSIDPEICAAWVAEIIAKSWCSFDDIDDLIARCEGDGELDELRINLRRTMEAAGFDVIDHVGEFKSYLWDARSIASFDELSEAVEATLTRKTLLPGTQRFVMDRTDELQLLEPMIWAQQELELGILASEAAVETILEVFDDIRDRCRDPGSVTLRTIVLSRPDNKETSEVLSAVEALRCWQARGRVMDGKQRREALAAIEALDLSIGFQKELVRSLGRDGGNLHHSTRLAELISRYENANEQLILAHLAYVRRFASRNVEEGEDPEDVFQVAFTGLQRSTRRFDPTRGTRFVVYCTYWMKQVLTRWRWDEGSSVRVPVHRHEKLSKLDRACDQLKVQADRFVSSFDLADHLKWTVHEVSQLRCIPRKAEYPENIDEWDVLMSEPEEIDAFDVMETKMIIREVLAELNERQADVIRKRFGIGCEAEMTLEEIGQFYGVTRERIRQIEAKGLESLSHPARKRRIQQRLGI